MVNMRTKRKYGRRSQRGGWLTMLSSMNRLVKNGRRASRRARRNLKNKQKGGFFL